MLSFLLDEHISPAVSIQIKNKNPEIVIRTLQTWEKGRYLGSSDKALLELANTHALTLVSYDVTTIPQLLKRLYEEDSTHAGVIFIDSKTIRPSNIGQITQALLSIWNKRSQESWTNRVYFV